MTAHVVLGQPRGGTSAVAGLLRMMGVFMGEKFAVRADKPCHEDLEMYSADLDTLERLILLRHKKYERWGWKDASLVSRWEQVRDCIPELEPVIVLRDPFAVAQSQVRWYGMRVDHAFRAAVKLNKILNREAVRHFDANGHLNDAHILSFERLRRKPEVEVERLARFVQAEPTDAMVRFVQSDTYREVA